jgi:hypothetical protein
MADIDSQLPVRSVADADEKVQVKLMDFADPDGADKQLEISEKKAHVRNFGKDSDAADRQTLLSQEGHTQSNGDYDAALNKRPSSQGLIVSDRSAAPAETTMNKRPTAVVGEGDSVNQDVALHHSNGDEISPANPLPTYIADDPGTEIEDPATGAGITKGNSSTHEYEVSADTEFRSLSANCSASGLAKFELQVETAAGSGVFTRKDTQFNSTANPNVVLGLKKPAPIAEGVKIRVVKTNLDNQAQDLYSTLNGIEVAV